MNTLFVESVKRLCQDGKLDEEKVVELCKNNKITEEEKKYILDTH